MIYCKDCKHYNIEGNNYGSYNWCDLDTKTITKHPIRPYKIYGNCKDLKKRNVNNDCKYFMKLSLWDKFKNWICQEE